MRKVIGLLIFITLWFKVSGQEKSFKYTDQLLLKGQYQEALKQLEKLPNSYEVFDKIASIYKSIGNYSNAINYYKKAIEISNKITDKVKLGNVYNLAGFKTKAVKTYEEIIQNDSSNSLVLNSLGNIYLARYRPDKAEKIYRFLEGRDSLNPNYPFQLAKVFSKQNKFLKMGQSYISLNSLNLLLIY